MDDSTLLQTLGQVSSDQVSDVFRQHLRGAVLKMISEVMAEEVTSLCGEKHRPSKGDFFRSGGSSGRVIYDGDREEILRHRVRQRHEYGSTSELQLETYQAARTNQRCQVRATYLLWTAWSKQASVLERVTAIGVGFLFCILGQPSQLARQRFDNQLFPWPGAEISKWVTRFNAALTDKELDALARCENRGAPFGGDDWVQKIVKQYRLESTIRPRGRPPKPKIEQKGT